MTKELKNKDKYEDINQEENNICKDEECQDDYPVYLNPFGKSNDNDQQLDNSEIECSVENDNNKEHLDKQKLLSLLQKIA